MRKKIVMNHSKEIIISAEDESGGKNDEKSKEKFKAIKNRLTI